MKEVVSSRSLKIWWNLIYLGMGVPIYIVIAGGFFFARYTNYMDGVNPDFLTMIRDKTTVFIVFLIFSLVVLMIAVWVLRHLVNVIIDKDRGEIYIDGERQNKEDVSFIAEAGLFDMVFIIVRINGDIRTWLPKSPLIGVGFPVFYRKKPRNPNAILFNSLS
jgi:hypothetical protein